MSFTLPKLDLAKDAQLAVAFLSSAGAVGTQLLHELGGFLPNGWAAGVTSALALVAGIAGFIQRNEPLIEEADKYL